MRDLNMAKKIATLVHQFGGSTYFVGGYVRDKFLNKSNKDIDIEVHGITPAELKTILESIGKVKTQGASFGVYNLHGYDIDIAQPRMEHVTGRGHKDFEVTVDPFIGTTKAAQRRDFTINAIMENVLTGEIIDPFNGLEDLKNNIIRHVDDKSFGEDPLRVLRAAQFAARFNFNIADETKTIMSKMDLSTLSKERIYEEMKKALLKSNKPSTFFEILRKVNQLDYWFPEVKALIDCKQDPTYHPEGDVWTHTMLTLDYAATNLKYTVSNPEYFLVTALCHDFGKPLSVTIDDDNKIHNYNHENIGVDVAKTFLSRLNLDSGLNKYVCNMIRYHMQPHRLFNSKSKAKKTNQMFDLSICPNDLCKLAEADNSNKQTLLLEENKFLEDRLAIYLDRINQPEVMGKDLIKLGLKPSPLFTTILSEAHKKHLSFVDKETVLKDITTRYVV